ncbi:hypothetical protein [Glycomyces buryatensis]|uniref:Uncharacterized protein n=1 Tax=Glycomyces buryatensis TaxID=2570927 RepID=A0A4V4HS64_9ACTN|nr:hypothetical protein [Glycomyces buryatensis]THV40566.1 hypothetical protein FAB82_14970 [Glycomyces buryatensis]
MHWNYVNFLNIDESPTSYGRTTVATRHPLNSENAIDSVAHLIRDQKRLANLSIMGIFKLES